MLIIYRIFTINPNGTGKQEIELKPNQEIINEIMHENIVAPLISPDGQKIAFLGRQQFNNCSLSVYTMDINGYNIQRIAAFYPSLAYAWLSNNEIAIWETFIIHRYFIWVENILMNIFQILVFSIYGRELHY
jgi:hypothetical protein